MTAAPRILVVSELAAGAPSKLTYELLGRARQLAATNGGSVLAALLTGKDEGAAQALIAHGADEVWMAEDAALAGYQGEAWVAVVARIAREAEASIVLAGHTAAGADLGPRLAFRLGTAIATGCTEVAFEDGKFVATRPCYGGNAREAVSLITAPAIATVRPGAYDAAFPDEAHRGEIKRLTPPFVANALRVKVIERRRETEGAAALEDARVIVAGGRGLNGPEGFKVLAELATALGGTVGASRVPCDLEWCPRTWQIGLTGRTVRPDLYFAVGISGAGHHMAGCGNAKTIVAVNTDPEAAIFKDARFGVVGDFREFIPALTAAVRALGVQTKG